MALNYQTAFVTIATVNFDAVVEFYQQLLAKSPNPYLPQRYAEFQFSGLRLGIFYPQLSHQEEFGNSVGSSMSLCLEVENLEAAIAYLNSLGGTLSNSMTTASHGKEIYGYDPAGNRLILHQSASIKKDNRA